MKNLQKVSKHDYKNIAKFLANFENEDRGEAFWLRRMKHWWDENPVYKDNFVRGLYIVDKEKNIIGFIGLIPTFFQFNYKTEIIYSLTTWRVNKKHRKVSLRMFSQILKEVSKKFLFDTTPTIKVEKILKAFKFKPLPRSHYHTYIYFLNFTQFFLKRFPLSKKFSFFLKPFFWSINYLQDCISKKSGPLQNTVQLFKAGKEFDDLWQETKNRSKNTNVRNADVINWLCFSGGIANRHLFGSYDKGKLIAYAIFTEITDESSKQLILSDLWGTKINYEVSREIFSAAIIFAKSNDFELVVFNSFNCQQDRALQKMRFFKKSLSQRRYYKSNNELAKEHTYLSMLQGDYSL